MFESLKQEWTSFKNAPPGERFKTEHELIADCPPWQRALRAVTGVAVTLAGVVLLFIPGPGTLTIAFGVAVLSGCSKPLARLMDRTEPRLRRWFRDRKHGFQALLPKGHA